MIVILEYKGESLLIKATPIGRNGYHDGKVIFSEPSKVAPLPALPSKSRRKRSKGAPKPETIAYAEKLREWLNKNPGEHPLYSTINRVLDIKSAGTAANVARAGIRFGWFGGRTDQKPHLVRSK